MARVYFACLEKRVCAARPIIAPFRARCGGLPQQLHASRPPAMTRLIQVRDAPPASGATMTAESVTASPGEAFRMLAHLTQQLQTADAAVKDLQCALETIDDRFQGLSWDQPWGWEEEVAKMNEAREVLSAQLGRLMDNRTWLMKEQQRLRGF